MLNNKIIIVTGGTGSDGALILHSQTPSKINKRYCKVNLFSKSI